MNKFRSMQIFVAVADARQLTRAAKTLHLSKSAVSHALTNLEEFLDLQLIKRDNRSWQLTDAGSIYYRQCKKILADVETMEDQTRQNRQTLSGLIRIATPDTFGSYTLTPVIAKFMELHPDISVDMKLTERNIDIIEERVDLAFKTGEVNESRLSVQIIGEAAVSIHASPDYIEKYGTPTSHTDLKNHKCIRYTRSPTWTLKKEGRTYEFVPPPYIMTDSGENMREFCIRGQGLAIMPTSLAEFAVKRGRLTRVLTDYEFKPMSVKAIMVRDNRAPTRVSKLLEFIVSELQTRDKDIAQFINAS